MIATVSAVMHFVEKQDQQTVAAADNAAADDDNYWDPANTKKRENENSAGNHVPVDVDTDADAEEDTAVDVHAWFGLIHPSLDLVVVVPLVPSFSLLFRVAVTVNVVAVSCSWTRCCRS